MKARNPSTGNFEEVYVKALDSLPVGSEIDFTGSASNIPIGWEEVDGKSLVAYTLYNGPATNNNITLSDSAVNYSQIEIFFHSVLGYRQSVKVIQNNIVIDLSTAYYESSANVFYVVGVKGTLQGTNLTLSDFFVAKNGVIEDLLNKYIYIDKVIGYKEV